MRKYIMCSYPLDQHIKVFSDLTPRSTEYDFCVQNCYNLLVTYILSCDSSLVRV